MAILVHCAWQFILVAVWLTPCFLDACNTIEPRKCSKRRIANEVAYQEQLMKLASKMLEGIGKEMQLTGHG